MAAALGEPYLISSYEYPTSERGEANHVYAHCLKTGTEENSVTVSVRQDGVYLLDVRILTFSGLYSMSKHLNSLTHCMQSLPSVAPPPMTLPPRL